MIAGLAAVAGTSAAAAVTGEDGVLSVRIVEQAGAATVALDIENAVLTPLDVSLAVDGESVDLEETPFGLAAVVAGSDLPATALITGPAGTELRVTATYYDEADLVMGFAAADTSIPVAPGPTPTPTGTSSPTPTASPSPTATPTVTPSPTPTVTPTATPSPTPTVTTSPTASPTSSPNPTPSGSPSAEEPEPTVILDPSATPVPTPQAAGAGGADVATTGGEPAWWLIGVGLLAIGAGAFAVFTVRKRVNS